MYLQSLATAFPPHAFTQVECFEALNSSGALEALRGRSRELLEKVLTGDSGIDTRRFCDPDLRNTFGLDASGLHGHFERHAPRLASEAVLKACQQDGLKPSRIDALLVCTCTGYLCPGLSSYVSEILGLRPDAFLQDLLGLGCGAALPLLETARGILAANPHATIATVAVEITSLRPSACAIGRAATTYAMVLPVPVPASTTQMGLPGASSWPLRARALAMWAIIARWPVRGFSERAASQLL
jgi:alkylresorcinol/alkylpyrone synthase